MYVSFSDHQDIVRDNLGKYYEVMKDNYKENISYSMIETAVEYYYNRGLVFDADNGLLLLDGLTVDSSKYPPEDYQRASVGQIVIYEFFPYIFESILKMTLNSKNTFDVILGYLTVNEKIYLASSEYADRVIEYARANFGVHLSYDPFPLGGVLLRAVYFPADYIS